MQSEDEAGPMRAGHRLSYGIEDMRATTALPQSGSAAPAPVPGRAAATEADLRTAVAAAGDAAAVRDLALLLQRAGRHAEALPALERWAAATSGSVAAWSALGRTHLALQSPAQAEAAWRRALATDPNHGKTLLQLGTLLRDAGRHLEAVELLRRATALRPASWSLWNELGTALHMQAIAALGPRCAAGGRPDEVEQAFAAYSRAAELSPGSPQPWINRGALAQQLGDLERAELAFRAAVQRDPEHWQANLNYAHLLLQLGRLDEGWQRYASRHAVLRTVKPVPPALPHWDGGSIAGRSIVLWHEQGHGDTLQFVRYAALLKALGAKRVGAAAPAPLARLLGSAPGVDEVVSHSGQDLRGYDCWAYYLDIPLRVRTRLNTIPAGLPYLAPAPVDVAAWRARLPRGGIKVALAWKGFAKHRNDLHRSLPALTALAPLWRVRGVKFISLQKGPGQEEAVAPPAAQPLADLGSQVSDFADSAAVLAGVDLVITVDTALAHLAGSLGRRVWVLLPAIATDWRWLLGRADSPWYPGVMRLFRQSRPGDWDAVIGEVAAELATFVAGQRGTKRSPARRRATGDR